MTLKRMSGWLIVCVEAVTIALMANTYEFPVAIAVIGLFGAVSKKQWHVNRQLSLVVALLLAAGFMMKDSVAPGAIPPRDGLVRLERVTPCVRAAEHAQ